MVLVPAAIEILSEEANLLVYASLLNRAQLLNERICSFRSKFFPLRVDPILKSYLIQRSKQKFMSINVTLFWKQGRGHLLEQGQLLVLIWYIWGGKNYLNPKYSIIVISHALLSISLYLPWSTTYLSIQTVLHGLIRKDSTLKHYVIAVCSSLCHTIQVLFSEGQVIFLLKLNNVSEVVLKGLWNSFIKKCQYDRDYSFEQSLPNLHSMFMAARSQLSLIDY